MWHAADAGAPRNVLTRASIAAAGLGVQQGVALVSGIVVARVIGAADYGIFNLARGLVDLTVIVTRLGLDIGLQRFFGEARSRDDHALRVAVLRRLRLLASLLAVVPIVAVAAGVGDALEARVYVHAGFSETLLVVALALPFLTDIAVLGGAYRGTLRLAPSVLAECVLLPTIRLAAIVILFLVGWRLWAVAVGTTLGAVLAATFLAARARIDFRSAAPADQPWHTALHVVRYSSVLAGAVLVTTLTATLDLLVLGHFATAEALGQYSLVKMLLVLAGLFGTAFNQTLGSLVAAHHARGNRDAVLHAIASTVRYIALGTVPLVLALSFWGPALLPLLGESFRTPPAVVAWLAASQLVTVVLGPAGWALSMTGRHVLELKILVSGLVIAAVACALAIPTYGPVGAAIATTASITATNALRAWFVRRTFGKLPLGLDIVAIAAVGFGAALLCEGALAPMDLPAFGRATVAIALFASLYGIAAWALLLTRAERDAARGLLERALLRLRTRAAA